MRVKSMNFNGRISKKNSTSLKPHSFKLGSLNFENLSVVPAIILKKRTSENA